METMDMMEIGETMEITGAMRFNAANWYWKAADGRIYSSARQMLVEETDEVYAAWIEAGNLPTPWPKDAQGNESEAALADVLAAHGLRLFAPTLEEVKDELKARVDEAAENERLKYITGGAGQAMTYQEKVAQAVSYTKAYMAHVGGLEEMEEGEEAEGAGGASDEAVPEPKMAEYPLLAAGLGVDGDTLLEVAETVIFAYAIWSQIGAEIEAMRLLAKANIEAAGSVEKAQALFDAVVWPNPQLLEEMAGDNVGGNEEGEEETS